MVSLRRACVARVTAVGFACLCVGRLESKHLTSRMSHGAINRLMNMRAWWHTNVKTIFPTVFRSSLGPRPSL